MAEERKKAGRVKRLLEQVEAQVSETLIEQFRLQILDEMATSLLPRRTGLPFEIWVSERRVAREGERPRMKVLDRKAGVAASLSIEEPGKLFAGSLPAGTVSSFVEYIQINHNLLLQLWNEEIDSVDYANRQVRLPEKGLIGSVQRELIRVGACGWGRISAEDAGSGSVRLFDATRSKNQSIDLVLRMLKKLPDRAGVDVLWQALERLNEV